MTEYILHRSSDWTNSTPPSGRHITWNRQYTSIITTMINQGLLIMIYGN